MRTSSTLASDRRRYPEHLHATPLPIMDRSPSQLSAVSSAESHSSTTELVSKHKDKQWKRMSLGEKFLSWASRAENAPDPEANELDLPTEETNGCDVKKKRLKMWHGWRIIVLGSWMNVLLLLIPVTWLLKLATANSDTLVFTASMLGMIPLVRLHDLAISVLSRRIGGSKAGLLNASWSNIVEVVVAVTALRKCELRVVQSSLIGSMLSKSLLILGMCFFAGGLRFSHQDYDTTATQIHSSLLSISVGAVCLPAAFHFALSNSAEDAAEAGTTLATQKEYLLKMSHSVSILLLFIYVSYLLFQLWSHTHLYKDSNKPSDKLPVAVSMRSFTDRVRQISNTAKGRHAYSRANSSTSLQSCGSAPEKVRLRKDKASPVEEAPETSFEWSNEAREPSVSPPKTSLGYDTQRERTAFLVSPSTTSQVTFKANEYRTTARGDPSIRLVQELERERGRSSSEQSHRHPRRFSSSSDERRRFSESGRTTPVSEVVSGYLNKRGEVVRLAKDDDVTTKARWVNVDVVEVRGKDEPVDVENREDSRKASEEEPELSWTMILMLLTVVSVLVTINAEWLVDSMDSLSPTLSKEWIGLILLPIVNSIPECVTAVTVSVRDQLTLSVSVAVGSTIQTSLFVIPFMVILGWILDKPLALLFDPFETVVLYISMQILSYVVADGKSNWLEGVILICLYLVIAVTFWFYPGSTFSSNLAVCVDTVKPA
ncbi:uncharacterized protein LAESUDRAFT_724523 [Laetiporus sulphureus 93-53]|uniref:Sodium/calcium exchanger membrane region domain-containing protein n=1 Tax=Laetiporus sulphureus 93-53 TaxID=1314785 RepID=A0A165EQY1_9APHY|nr:uncharacterized protein LAESUDRAFT_724523 [Laetiporus sulphureus 93-53]KZT07576.1 hypothetical protein LAESUDRAFT_724523 [Laetiporus sulphureus 93-53]